MGWWIFLNFHNFSVPCFIHPWMEYLFVTHIQIHPNNKLNGWEAGYERVNSSSFTHHDMRLCHARGSMSRVSVVTCRKQLKWYLIRLKWKRKCSQSTEVFIFTSPCGWGRVAEVSDSWLSPVLRPETISHEPGPGSVRGSRHFYLVYWLRTFFLGE